MIGLRERIVKKALQVMNTQGIKFTTVDLARELGVSKRTLYEHFKSKEDIIAAVFDTIFTDLQAQSEEILRDQELGVIEKLTELIVAYPKVLGPINERIVGEVKRFLPNEWAKFEAYHEKKWSRIEGIINQGIGQGLLRPVNMAILHRMFIGAINELQDWQFLIENDITFTRAMMTLAEVMILGLLAGTNIESKLAQK